MTAQMFRTQRMGLGMTLYKVWLVGTKEPEQWTIWSQLTPEQQAIFAKKGDHENT